MKRKLLIIFCIFSLICFQSISIADDEIDELEVNDVDNIIEASAKLEEDLKINSRIAIAYDRETGLKIWGKEENKKTAMASTTKIMTAIVVIENSNLDDVIEVSKKAAWTGGSKLGLKTGDKISVRDLLYGLMLRSGNDSAVALAEYVGGSIEGFADLMNQKARELNLNNTHFVTPHGLDNPEHYTTAMELAKLADYALNNEIFAKIVKTKNTTIYINGNPKSINNTNELLGNFPGVYGVKTGFTNNAGRCLVTAVKNDKFNIITVVIQADTKKDRTNDSVKLIKYIFNNYEKINIEEIVNEDFHNWLNINKSRIHINKAKNNNFSIEKTNLTHKEIIVKKSNAKDINILINAIFEYEAPVENKTKIGEIKIYIGEEFLETVDIFFDNQIIKKDFYDYIHDCINIISDII